MTQFQQTVNIYAALGVVGEISFDGPIRAKPFNLFSSGTPNLIGNAFTITAAANPDNTAGSPNAPTAQVGGSGVFGGILISPKEYAAFGISGSPLSPTLTLPDYTTGYLMTMGYCFVNLPGPANPGDVIAYDPATGNLNSYAPTVSFTGSIAAGGAGLEDVLTVSAISAGVLKVGAVISGTGVQGGTTITALGTGIGGTGTYKLSTINTQTVSSEAMTANGLEPLAFSGAGYIAGTTLTITTAASGEVAIGTQLFGTGVLPNTVVTALGSGVGGTGTYTVNNSQTIGSSGTPITLTGPSYITIRNCVVDVYGGNSAGGVTSIKITQ